MSGRSRRRRELRATRLLTRSVTRQVASLDARGRSAAVTVEARSSDDLLDDLDNYPTLGFTGTRRGMTPIQQATVRHLLRELTPRVVHHGDCVGADAEFHQLAESLGKYIIVHPPDRDELRAFCRGNLTLPPLPYAARNRAIVDASLIMVAAPGTEQEELRSGTWTTIRYAVQRSPLLYVVLPTGLMMNERLTD